MNPIRYFSIQTCKTSRLIFGGGKPELTPDMAAHYCKGMPKHWYQAALLCWADNWSGANDLEYKLWDKAVKLKIRERWRIEKKYEGKEMLRKLAGLAIWEMGEPKRFKHPESWRRRADWMGLDKAAWYRTWRPRYEAVYGILSEWANEAKRHIRKEIAKDEFEQ